MVVALYVECCWCSVLLVKRLAPLLLVLTLLLIDVGVLVGVVCRLLVVSCMSSLSVAVVCCFVVVCNCGV